MNNLRTISLATLLVAAMLLSPIIPATAQQTSDTDDSIMGVPYTLAERRSEQIKNLNYDVEFFVPHLLDNDLLGRTTISFDLECADTIVLDFIPGEGYLTSVKVNDVSVEPLVDQEHILIDAESVREGRNSIVIEFVASDMSLNRTKNYLYTLLVPDRARTLIPCFDQPDLKARYTLHLNLPSEWDAVANAEVVSEERLPFSRVLHFAPTEPLSTYLFSFVAGEFHTYDYQSEERAIRAYYVETEEYKVEQLDTICHQVIESIRWMEEYTAIDYPFAKYDLVLLPSFQYGGMEHTGATLYNSTRLFVSKMPTQKEYMQRINVIAHETAHMWFGDYVTMRWFDDVWTKEVFAGYFASLITEPLFENIDHRLEWMSQTVFHALDEDRTDGTTPIKQSLDNLNNAGLVYNNIIYFKAPIMMRKLVEIMGEEPFREGVREYLNTFAYGNASWEELVAILDKHSDADITAFSDVWVNSKGMPHITLRMENGMLHAEQADKWGRDLVWPQSFEVMAIGDSVERIEVDLTGKSFSAPLPAGTRYIIPNSDGRGYGHFITSKQNREWALRSWYEVEDNVARFALLMALNENFENGLISSEEWYASLVEGVAREECESIAQTIPYYLGEVIAECSNHNLEQRLYDVAMSHSLSALRKYLIVRLAEGADNPNVVGSIKEIWSERSLEELSEYDYSTIAHYLMIRFPDEAQSIADNFLQNCESPIVKGSFEYTLHGTVTNDKDLQVAYSHLLHSSRYAESVDRELLRYLNSPMRKGETVVYIYPMLKILPLVQRKSDIFFPSVWCMVLLNSHRSLEAYNEVMCFLEDNPDLHPLLRNKVMSAFWSLQRYVLSTYGTLPPADHSKSLFKRRMAEETARS